MCFTVDFSLSGVTYNIIEHTVCAGLVIVSMLTPPVLVLWHVSMSPRSDLNEDNLWLTPQSLSAICQHVSVNLSFFSSSFRRLSPLSKGTSMFAQQPFNITAGLAQAAGLGRASLSLVPRACHIYQIALPRDACSGLVLRDSLSISANFLQLWANSWSGAGLSGEFRSNALTFPIMMVI